MDYVQLAIDGLALYGLYDLLWRFGVIELLVKEMKHRREMDI
jgi:hypothetical protein